jgi:putative acetyltransferase
LQEFLLPINKLPQMKIIIAHSDEEYKTAAILFQEYAAWLNIDLSFQKFDDELLHLKAMYNFPSGAIFLSKENKIFTGCVAIRKIDTETAELKRMFIRDIYRGKGVASSLLQNAIEKAIQLGYKKIRLDTLDNMIPAINLYKKNGFYEIEPYYFNPEKNAIFFEKVLI